MLEECLRVAQTLVISQAATLALHIATILVVLIESWWKPYQKLFRVGTVVVSPTMAFGEMAFFCYKTYQGEEQVQEEDLRCSRTIHIFLQQVFSSLDVHGLLPFGSKKLCIFVSSLGLFSL